MIAKENDKKCRENQEYNVKLWMQAVQLGINFMISAVLAGGMMFGMSAPFGVAMVGASGWGLSGVAALLGAGVGYLLLHNFSLGLRYVSASILTFALGFCFYDVKALKEPWVMAGCTGLISALTGFFYLSFGGWTSAEFLFYWGEILVTVLATWAFSLALAPLRREKGNLRLDLLPQRIALLLFSCALLISLSGLMLWEGVSFGRSLGALVVLGIAWREGVATGAILGLCAGLALDVSGFQQGLYGMTWGISALCAGFFRGKSRLHSGLAFLLVSGCGVLWSVEDTASLGILYEVLLGSLLFCLLPVSWLELVPVLEVDSTLLSGKKEHNRVQQQLSQRAQAFQLLGETLKTAFRTPSNQNDVSVIFHRAAQKVCQKCYLRHTCWEKEYGDTRTVMNDATSAILARGKAMPEDFSLHFAHRCLHYPLFLEEVNHQLTAFLYRRQYQNRLRESRMAVCGQYGQLSQLLQQASQQISEELSPQVKKAKKMGQYLGYLGMEAQVSLVENSQGMLSGEIWGEDISALTAPEVVSELSQLLQVPIRLVPEGEGLRLYELEPFMALAGFASCQKEGERVCGDQTSYFKREDGKLFVMVCDGMGSGEKAKAESSLAIELLERFLKAGVDSVQALHILNGALALRGEEGGGFTTVDLLELDLVTAQGVLYKYGAAPSYYRHGDEIRRIVGKSMPAGADFGELNPPDQIKLVLDPEDYLLMVSDGVSGVLDQDMWLCQAMETVSGEDLKALSRKILDMTPDGGKDDRTVALLKLAYRRP